MTKSTKTTMQEFLEDYRKGESFLPSLLKFISKNPQNKMAIILKKIATAITDKEMYGKYIQEIQSFPFQNYAIEEQLIFLQDLGHLYVSQGHINNGYLILNNIKNIINKNLSVEWQVIPKDIEFQIAIAEGNLTKTLDTIKSVVDFLTPNSGRYIVYLWPYLMFLTLSKDQVQFNDYFKKFKTHLTRPSELYKIDYILLLASFERCDFNNVYNLITQINKSNFTLVIKNDLQYMQTFSEYYINQQILKQNDKSNLDRMTDVHILLLKKQYEKALTLARELSVDKTDFTFTPYNLSYFLVRSELANKNILAASYSLQKRLENQNTTIHDDFFYFRIHHLKNELEQAQFYFNKYYKYILRNNLEERMSFEVSLSPELNLGVMMKYASNYKSTVTEKFTQNILSKQPNLNTAFIGKSEKILAIKRLLEKVALLETPILILGETGTGKDVLAKTIHNIRNFSEKYLPINCSSISDHLLQSELFGHVKGSFTGANDTHHGVFEEASKGTVFLDEIGDISPAMQIALLRLLESGEYRPIGSNEIKKVSCKIIMATNQNLSDLVNKGVFREDLKYRIERMVIEIPSLKERKEDIPLLIEYFLNDMNPNLPKITFDRQTIKHLTDLPWEGNIRELRNEMEKVRLFYSDKTRLTMNELSEKYKNKHADPLIISHENVNQKNNIGFNSKNKRYDELKNLFLTQSPLSKKEAMLKLNISSNTAISYLKALELEGFIRKSSYQVGKNQYYEKSDLNIQEAST